MFPPPPFQAGSPNALGPAGLDAAVAKLFGSAPPPGAPPPDVYANLNRKVLLDRFLAAKKDGQDIRWVFERQWWRVMLYVLGRQWIFFDGKRNEWRDKRLKKWIPKPVTNKLREVQAAIRAMFAAVQLGTISRPNGNDPKNVATAATVDGLQPLIHEEHDMDRVMRLSDFWMVTLGNCLLHPWWDKDGGPVKPVMHEQCVQCGTVEDPAAAPVPGQFQCPACGGQQSEPTKVGDAPTGKGCTDVVSPFEILVPSYASAFEECDKVIRVRWRPKAFYESHYPELVRSLRFTQQTQERSLHLFKALAAQNDMSTTPFTFGAGQRAQAEGITEYEYWERPNATYPKGLFFRVVGDTAEQILEDPDQSSPGPLPTTTNTGEPLWPWIWVGYEPFGGRLWASGAIDPLIQKQDQLNQLDSHVQMSLQRMGNPIWLEPKGTEVEKFTGEPGLVVKYNLLGTTGQGKPERIPGEDIRPGVFELRRQYLSDIEELAGTYDILKGNKPTGVEAFSALQLLVERSQSRFTNAFAARGEAYQAWFRIAIELERQYGPPERIRALMGPNNSWTFQTFSQADLQGDVTIVVEDGTNVPKTALGKRAAMEQAHNMGFVDPADPDQKFAFLSEMGLTNLMPGLDTAKKAALRQQDAFEQWALAGLQGPPPLKIQPWDDPVILLTELRKWANGDKMQGLLNDPASGPIVQEILGQFYQQLMLMITPPPMPAEAGGAGSPPPPGGHTPGAGQAMRQSNTNSTKPAIANHGQPTAPVSPVVQ